MLWCSPSKDCKAGRQGNSLGPRVHFSGSKVPGLSKAENPSACPCLSLRIRGEHFMSLCSVPSRKVWNSQPSEFAWAQFEQGCQVSGLSNCREEASTWLRVWKLKLDHALQILGPRSSSIMGWR